MNYTKRIATIDVNAEEIMGLITYYKERTETIPKELPSLNYFPETVKKYTERIEELYMLLNKHIE